MAFRISNYRHLLVAGVLGGVSGFGYKYLRDDVNYRKQFLMCTAATGLVGVVYGYTGASIGKFQHRSQTAIGSGVNGMVLSAVFMSIRKFLTDGHPKINAPLKEYIENSLQIMVEKETMQPLPASLISGALTGSTLSLIFWGGMRSLAINALVGGVLGVGAHFAFHGVHLLYLELAIRHNYPEVTTFPESVQKETWAEWMVRIAAKKTALGEIQTKVADLEMEYLRLQDLEDELLKKRQELGLDPVPEPTSKEDTESSNTSGTRTTGTIVNGSVNTAAKAAHS